MATQTDNLRIVVSVDGEGNVRASLANVAGGLDKVDNTARRATPSMQGFGAALGAIGFYQFIQGAVQTIATTERLRATLASVEGSVQKANVAWERYSALAARTPFTLEQIVQAGVKLKNFGLDPLDGTLQALVDQSAALGGEFETLNGIILAFGQANAKGRLQGEELLQLAERGVPVYEALARIMGVSTTEISKMAAQGQIGADVVKQLVTEVGRLNDGAAARQADTLGGAFNNLRTAVQELIVAVGDSGLTGSLTHLLAEVAAGIRGLEDLFSTMENGEQSVSLVAQAFSSLAVALESVIAAAKVAGTSIAAIIDFLDGLREGAVAAASATLAMGEAMADVARGDLQGAAEAFKRATDTYTDSVTDLERRLETIRSGVFAGIADASAPVVAAFMRMVGAAQESSLAATEADISNLKLETAVRRLTPATNSQADADKRAAEALRERNRAMQESLDVMADIEAQGQAVLDRLFPEMAAERRRGEDANALRESMLAGFLTPEGFREAMRRLENEGTPAVEDVAETHVSAYTEVWLRATEDARHALIDGLLEGDWEDVGERLAKSIVAGFLDVWLSENFSRPLQDAIMGWTSGGRGGMPVSAVPGAGGMSIPIWGSAGGSPFNGTGPMASFGMPGSFAMGPGGQGGMNMPGFGGLGQSGGFMGYAGAALGYGAGGYMIGSNIFGGSTQNGIGGAVGGMAGGLLAGTTMGATVIGAGLSAMGVGAALGSVVPIVGTIIGAIIGAAIGELFEKDPSLEASSRRSNITNSRVEAEGTSQLGQVFFATEDIDFDRQGFVDALVKLDDAIASLLDPEQIERAREALADWDVDQRGRDINPMEALSDRVNTIFAAVTPEFAGFLANIEDLEERIKAFEGLRHLEQQLEALETTLGRISRDPMQALNAQLDELDQAVTDTTQALADAIDAQDPAAIAQAAGAAEQAILRRYQTELQLVLQLQQALDQAEAQAFQLNFGLAQRIQATGGPIGQAAGIAAAQIPVLQGQVLATTDPTRALGYLNQFISTVDTWLNQAIADANTLLQAEQQRIATRMGELDAERQEILANGQARAQREAELERRRQAAANAHRQALQEQLRVAQQWLAVIQSADALTRDLTFSSSNPLGGFARLSLLDAEIGRMEGRLAGAGSEDQARIASDLLGLLERRMGLVQQEGLFDRPSGEFLDLFNDTLARINAVRELAQPEADRATVLQEELNRLQRETSDAVGGLSGTNVRVSAAEQLRLEEIAAEEALLREELAEAERIAQETRAAAQAEANAYYVWAQGEAQKLEDQRQAALREQLDRITGGRPIEEWMNEALSQTEGLLRDIRDDVRAFLDAISDTPVPGAPGDGRPPGEPPPGEVITPAPKSGANTITLAPTIHVTAGPGTDGAAIGKQVADALNAQLPQLASQLKRELATA